MTPETRQTYFRTLPIKPPRLQKSYPIWQIFEKSFLFISYSFEDLNNFLNQFYNFALIEKHLRTKLKNLFHSSPKKLHVQLNSAGPITPHLSLETLVCIPPSSHQLIKQCF